MEEPEVCLSTEELVAGICEVNRKCLNEEVIAGSADVTVEKVCEVLYTSDTKFDGIDVDELGLYLTLNCSEMYLRERDINCYCPTSKTNRGRPPVITGCALDENKSNRFSRWNRAISRPSVDTTRKRH